MKYTASINRLLFGSRSDDYPTYAYPVKIFKYFDCSINEQCIEYEWTCPVCGEVSNHRLLASEVLSLGHPIYLTCSNLRCGMTEDESETKKKNKMNLLEFVSMQVQKQIAHRSRQ